MRIKIMGLLIISLQIMSCCGGFFQAIYVEETARETNKQLSQSFKKQRLKYEEIGDAHFSNDQITLSKTQKRVMRHHNHSGFHDISFDKFYEEIDRDPPAQLNAGAILYVGGSGPGNYTSIQSAIDAAAVGDTVFVYNGTYYEYIRLYKDVDLLGESRNGVVIVSGFFADVVQISADGVYLADVTIQNEGGFTGIWCTADLCWINNCNVTSSGSSWGGIGLDSASACWITFCNIFSNYWHGIYLFNGSCSNLLWGLAVSDTVGSGVRIYDGCDNNTMTVCSFAGCADGLYLEYAECTQISGCSARNCERGFYFVQADRNKMRGGGACDCVYGLVLNTAENNTIGDLDFCSFQYNDVGIFCNFSKNNDFVYSSIVTDNLNDLGIWLKNSSINRFIDVWIQGFEVGMHLQGSDENVLFHCMLWENPGNALFLESSDANCISGSDFHSNVCSIDLYDSVDNLFYHNNFYNNTYHVTGADSNIWDNGYPSGGNYWDTYVGDDFYSGPMQNESGSDGIGDWGYLIGSSVYDRYPFVEYDGWRLWGDHADLIVTDVWMEDGMVCYQLRNIGTVNASTYHISMFAIDEVYQNCEMIDVVLEPDERYTSSFHVGWWCSYPSDFIQVLADATDSLGEISEINNWRNETWICDTVAPTFVSEPTISDVTTDSARVVWETDEASYGHVRYSKKAAIYDGEEQEEEPVWNHDILLSDLEPSTTYHVETLSIDEYGNRLVSEEYFFETDPVFDDIPPTITLQQPDDVFGTVTLTAQADDETGVDHVNWYIDDTLVSSDYSCPFTHSWDTSSYQNEVYNVTSESLDLYGNAQTDHLPLNVTNIIDYTEPQVEITSPTNGEKVSGKITVLADVSDDTGLYFGWYKVDGNWSATWYPNTKGTLKTTISMPWDTTLVENGQHRIGFEIYDIDLKKNIGYQDVIVNNVPLPPPPKLVLTDRKITREKNFFNIDLFIENKGGQTATDVRICDYLQLFQPISKSTQKAEYTAEFNPSSLSWKMYLSSNVNITPGQTRIYRYCAVPVLSHPFDYILPIIGGNKYDESLPPLSGTNIWWKSPLNDSFYEIFQKSSMEMDSYLEAIKCSDYLIVTSPKNLLLFNSEDDVNQLLSSMAKLAKQKRGVLGFLDISTALNRNLEDGDGFAIGDIIGTKRDDIVIGDIVQNRIIYYYQNLRKEGSSGSRHLERDWIETRMYCGWNNEGFEKGDTLAIGDFMGTDREEIAMLDYSADRIIVYNVRTGGIKHHFVDFESYDGLLLGDITGSDKEEVFVLDRSKDSAAIYNQNWKKIKEFTCGYDKFDGYAIGNVRDDHFEELIVADASSDTIKIYNWWGLTDTFSFPFNTDYSITVGNVQGNQFEEIIITVPYVNSDTSRVFVFDGYGNKLDEYEPDYKIVDLHKCDSGRILDGEAVWWNYDELAIASITSDLITIDSLADDFGDPHVLQDLLKKDDSRKLELSGLWSEKLCPTYCDEGYLLIVGETEIVPAFGDIYKGTIPTTQGDRDLHIDCTDYPYASTHGKEWYPELHLGRIIGRNASAMKTTIDISINVAQENPGYGFDRDTAYLMSGYNKCIHGGCDDCNFKGTRDKIMEYVYYDHGILTSLIHSPDFTEYNESGINETLTTQIFRSVFWSSTPNKDIIHLGGHGNGHSIDLIDDSNVREQQNPFGSTNPFITTDACRSGRYHDRNGIAEAFFEKGAGAYLGWTESGAYPAQYDVLTTFYRNWDSNESVGKAFSETRRSFSGKVESFLCGMLHIFGDPKYGLHVTTPYESSTLTFEKPAALPAASFTVTIPDYTINSSTGSDFVEIPNGTHYFEEAMPLVPIYTIQSDYPAGSQIQNVKIKNRSDPLKDSGIDIQRSYYSLARCTPCSRNETDPQIPEWWPMKSYEWTTIENSTTTTLVITIYPFYYNYNTTQVQFHKQYNFTVNYTDSNVEITQLQLDKTAYRQNESVRATITVSNPAASPQNSSEKCIVSAKIIASDTQTIVDGLLLQTIHNFSQNTSYSSIWDTTGIPTGTYSLCVDILDYDGTLLDTRIQQFTLGSMKGEITAFTVSPQFFDIGDQLVFNTTIENTGERNLTGRLSITIQNGSAYPICQFIHNISNLSQHHEYSCSDRWNSSNATDMSYLVQSTLIYNSKLAKPIQTIISTNHPPIADFCYSPASPVFVNEIVMFNSTNSSDPDGTINACNWDFNDGTTSNLSHPTHRYLLPGFYQIRLLVTDNNGTTNSTLRTIEVILNNSAPDSPRKPSGVNYIATHVSYTYRTKTTDPEHDQVYYQWDWDDGNVSSWLGPYDSDETAFASHQWTQKGTYLVKVRSKDEYGFKGSWSPAHIVKTCAIKISKLHSISCPVSPP